MQRGAGSNNVDHACHMLPLILLRSHAWAGMPCRVQILLPPTAVLHLVPAQTGATPLYVACEYGQVEVVKELLSRGAAVDKARQVHCGAAALVC